MFSHLSRRFVLGTVTVAVVLAAAGGAYGASKYLITSLKQIKPSVREQLKGAAGKNGAPGATGATGAQGPAGPQGPAGASGGTGETGKEGPAGKEGSPGKNGTNGKEGSPWTDGGTLPSNTSEGKPATETGTWSLGSQGAEYRCFAAPEEEVENKETHKKEKVHTGVYEENNCETEAPENPKFGKPVGNFEREMMKHYPGPVVAQISFPIRLAAALDKEHVIYVHQGETPTAECPGTISSPEAAPGYLCVYETEVYGVETTVPEGHEGKAIIAPPTAKIGELASGAKTGAGTTGALVSFNSEREGDINGWGTWAVTAPEES